MSAQSKTPGVLIFLFIVIVSIISFRASLPPEVIPASDTDSFSAERAMHYLREVAAEPHASGTSAHEKVRNYIAEYCRQKGLEVEIQSGIDFDRGSNWVDAAFVKNIIATLKGTNPNGKAILVASHYDSQINTAAAADDGAAVAAQMEVIDMLTKSSTLENDVIFLFTDSEEMGLDGANYFVDNYDNIEGIGLILNFEARGNSGSAYSFETTSENGWMLREFKKAVKKPISNSLAYEIYKLMPNGTDFTEFKHTGITGINSAFIDGWAYYHSPADTPDNIDQRSLQHHGDHMLGMVRHFGNMDLSETKASDVIFFNPMGGWLMVYSQSLDLPLILLTVLLWVLCVVKGNKQKRTKWKSIFAGSGLMLLSLVVAMLILFGYQQLTNLLADTDSTWFASNKYQMGNTLIVIVGLALLSFGLVFKRSLKGSFESTYLGALLFSILLIIPVKLFTPTGGYILYFPILIALVVYLSYLFLKIELKRGVPYAVGQMVALFIPLGLWIPMAYMIFIVFGMGLPFGTMLFLVFFFPFLIPAYKMVSGLHHRLVVYTGLLIALIGQVLLFTGKGYTETTPRHSFLSYVVSDSTAHWYSRPNMMDDWNDAYLSEAEVLTTDMVGLNPDRKRELITQEAALVNRDYLQHKVIAEDTTGNRRHITLQIEPVSSTFSMLMRLPKGTIIGGINASAAQDRDTRTGDLYLSVIGVPNLPFSMTFSFPLNSDPAYVIQEQKIGIPNELLTTPMPSNFVHHLYSSNLFLVNSSGKF
ncbi:MAG: M28 family peptidase [Roseivirga sp.]|nr:M28 family peptidase [Roseivirga sp.]